MTEVSAIGIDLAKNVFEICGQDAKGVVVLRRRVRRGQFLPSMANIPSCLVGMESCAGSNYWAREIQALGHRVRMTGGSVRLLRMMEMCDWPDVTKKGERNALP